MLLEHSVFCSLWQYGPLLEVCRPSCAWLILIEFAANKCKMSWKVLKDTLKQKPYVLSIIYFDYLQIRLIRLSLIDWWSVRADERTLIIQEDVHFSEGAGVIFFRVIFVEHSAGIFLHVPSGECHRDEQCWTFEFCTYRWVSACRICNVDEFPFSMFQKFWTQLRSTIRLRALAMRWQWMH